MAAVSWTDSSGNLWLFGGDGYDADGGAGYLNDLWEFNPSNQTMGRGWAEAARSQRRLRRLRHVGTPAAGNIPGGRVRRFELDRQAAAISGSLAEGYGSVAGTTRLSQRPVGVQSIHERMDLDGRKQRLDLPIATAPIAVQPGVYGTLGTCRWKYPRGPRWPRAGPTAAAISGSLAADGSTDCVWLLNDLWEVQSFHQANGPGWAEARCTHGATSGVYGTLGTPAAGNIPRRPRLRFELDRQQRQFLALWRLWLQMPTAMMAISTTCGSSILPRTNGHGWAEAARQAATPAGVYGTLGRPLPANIPGGR